MTLLTAQPTAVGSRVILGDPSCAKMEKSVITRWFADKGDHTLRVDYPLTRDSIVLDVGGYEGNWAAQIHERYGCRIHIFEPVPQFAAQIEQRFAASPSVTVHRFGLSDHTLATTIYLSNDGTSVHKAKGDSCAIHLKSAQEVFAELGLAATGIDLMKINIEGCEFELLEHLMTTGLVRHLRDIQVQFHDFVPDASARMAAIQTRLADTHDLLWQYRFVWENWRRRSDIVQGGHP